MTDTSDFEQLLDTARELAKAADLISKQADARRREAILVAIDSGMSQTEIARRLGITQQRVAQIIKNSR
ncbi:MAG: helix-turn-helix domain-containing protein [Gordonia sp. (in: high G+C Gram-positive bacteria)]